VLNDIVRRMLVLWNLSKVQRDLRVWVVYLVLVIVTVIWRIWIDIVGLDILVFYRRRLDPIVLIRELKTS